MNEHIENLIADGYAAANQIDSVFEATHPFGTSEAETIRELCRALEASR